MSGLLDQVPDRFLPDLGGDAINSLDAILRAT
jgi:hypothetical protein